MTIPSVFRGARISPKKHSHDLCYSTELRCLQQSSKETLIYAYEFYSTIKLVNDTKIYETETERHDYASLIHTEYHINQETKYHSGWTESVPK